MSQDPWPLLGEQKKIFRFYVPVDHIFAMDVAHGRDQFSRQSSRVYEVHVALHLRELPEVDDTRLEPEVQISSVST